MKRARRRTLQEDLRRHAKRLCEPFMRDGRLPSPEARYQGGDNTVILSALMRCLYSNEVIEAVEKADRANTGIPLSIPVWLWKALFRALGRAYSVEVDSWDDVFGPPVQTKDGRPARGKSRLALRRKMELQFDIYWRVEELTAQEKTVDKELFERIAKEHGIGRAKAEQIYYETRAIAELVTCSLRGRPLRD